MKEIGILGLGGSGFPTFVKYENAKNINTILINAVECEPYLTSDYKIIEKSKTEYVKNDCNDGNKVIRLEIFIENFFY